MFFLDVDVAPTHGFADPGAERFCYRFLAGETRSQMALREFHRHRIFDFTICENAMQETISETLHGTLDPRALDNIDADADHAHFVTQAERPCVVGQALRLPCPAMATGAVALQFCPRVQCSSVVIRHCGKHFFHRGFQSDPRRARDDGVTDVEFGQTWNLVYQCNVFVIDAVTGVDLHVGF